MSPLPDTDFDAEPPTFWLGVAGFTPDERALIGSALHRTTPVIQWELSPFRDADAWLVNGARCSVLSNGNLRVAPGSPHETALELDLLATDRPVAFGTPINASELEPRCTFDPGSRPSIQVVLAEFDQSLRWARAQFLLGSQVVELGATLRHGIFQVSNRHKLLATMDFRSRVATLSPHIDPDELQGVRWTRRSVAARCVPPGFVRTSPAQLAWNYCRRSQRDLLPARYRESTIYYRDVPRVPAGWLRETHLRILQALRTGSGTLAQLRERLGQPLAEFERDLACLFYASAITTTPSKANRCGSAVNWEDPSSASPPSLLDLDADAAYARMPVRADPTVPGDFQSY